MTLKESYRIIGLNEGASLDEVKSAYRKRAFDLHPDLNPDVPNVSKEFHKLNEAYVFLSKRLSSATKKHSTHGTHAHADTSKAREEAQKAYGKAKQTTSTKKETQQEEAPQKETSKEDLLNDILKDDFARRVFEDIYRHIAEDSQKKTNTENNAKATEKKTTAHSQPTAKLIKKLTRASNGPVTKLSGWLRKQFDDKQTISLPKASLIAGAKIRLEIQHGLLTKPQTVELVLPDNFSLEKPIRLKGMGKHIGNWHGDLYLEINPY